MEDCAPCKALTTFPFSQTRAAFPFLENVTVPDRPPPTSRLVKAAFRHNANSDGLAELALETAEMRLTGEQPLEILETATSRYQQRYRQPNCFAVAVAHGVRGAVVGSVFGGAWGLSTAVQSGYRGSAVFSYAGQGALRNAAGFGSWTGLFGFSRCGLARLRGRHDMINSALAGGFTGGVLTLISARGYWRYAQAQILTNAGASAMIAVMFDALGQM